MENYDLKPTILHAHKTLCPPDWSWDSRKNKWDGFHLWFIAGGAGKAWYQKKEYSLKPGSCFLLRMWEPFIASHNPANPLLVCAFNFNYFDAMNHSLAKQLTAMPARYREIPDVRFFQGLVERCVGFFTAGQKKEALIWLKAVLSEILKHDSLLAIKDSFKHDFLTIHKLCAEIEQAASDKKYEIKQLAQNAGYSTDHFIRIFKRFKGSTPKNFIIQTKIAAAKNMLLFSSYTIQEIAEKLGYADVYSFSKQFGKFSGKSPGAYRRAQAEQ